MFRRGEGAGMPAGATKIRPEINPGKHEVDPLPKVGAESDAIGRGAIDAVGLEVARQRCAPVTERTRGGDGLAHGRLLDIGGDDADLAEAGGDPGESENAGAVDAVVVGNKYAQFHPE